MRAIAAGPTIITMLGGDFCRRPLSFSHFLSFSVYYVYWLSHVPVSC